MQHFEGRRFTREIDNESEIFWKNVYNIPQEKDLSN